MSHKSQETRQLKTQLVSRPDQVCLWSWSWSWSWYWTWSKTKSKSKTKTKTKTKTNTNTKTKSKIQDKSSRYQSRPGQCSGSEYHHRHGIAGNDAVMIIVRNQAPEYRASSSGNDEASPSTSAAKITIFGTHISNVYRIGRVFVWYCNLLISS